MISMRKTIRIVSGFGLILLGIPLLVLPGPGFITIFAGITLIASEFEWASGVVDWAKEKTALLRGSEGERLSDTATEDQTG